MVRRKKKAGVLRRSLLSAFAVIAFLVLGIYIFFGIYFRNHFFYQTSIEDVNVSGMTAEDAAGMISQGADMIQIYSAFIYSGPSIVHKLGNKLKNELK